MTTKNKKIKKNNIVDEVKQKFFKLDFHLFFFLTIFPTYSYNNRYILSYLLHIEIVIYDGVREVRGKSIGFVFLIDKNFIPTISFKCETIFKFIPVF